MKNTLNTKIQSIRNRGIVSSRNRMLFSNDVETVKSLHSLCWNF
jgi:hypothetical protein